MTASKVASVRIDAKNYPLPPEIEQVAFEKLRKSLRNEACCDIFLTDWEHRPAYTDEDGNEWAEAWQIVAYGSECATALEWREKAETWKQTVLKLSDQLREPSDLRADLPKA